MTAAPDAPSTVATSTVASSAVEIEVQVPSMLRDCTGDRAQFTTVASTLREALDRLMATYPLLRLHVYDEANRLRPHLLLYLNDTNAAHLPSLDVPLAAGDRLIVLQNVSGG